MNRISRTACAAFILIVGLALTGCGNQNQVTASPGDTSAGVPGNSQAVQDAQQRAAAQHGAVQSPAPNSPAPQ